MIKKLFISFVCLFLSIGLFAEDAKNIEKSQQVEKPYYTAADIYENELSFEDHLNKIVVMSVQIGGNPDLKMPERADRVIDREFEDKFIISGIGNPWLRFVFNKKDDVAKVKRNQKLYIKGKYIGKKTVANFHNFIDCEIIKEPK